MNAEAKSNSRLRSRWLAWSAAALSVALVATGLLLSWLALMAGEGSARLAPHQFLNPLITLTFAIVGALVASRHPRNPIGWMLAATGFLSSLNLLAQGYWMYSEAVAVSDSLPGAELAHWLDAWVWFPEVTMPVTFLLLLFPDGRLLSTRWRPIGWAAGLGMAAGIAAFALDPRLVKPEWAASAELSPLKPVASILSWGAWPLIGIAFFGSLASLIVRFRRSSGTERDQLKWLVYATGIALLVLVLGNVVSRAVWPSYAREIGIGSTGFAMMPIIIAIGIAIVRHRLYDIDVLINRTLVYGALTASVVALYVLIVGGLGILLQTQDNLPGIVIAILLIAFLFQPMRRRWQDIVNRFVPVHPAILRQSTAAAAPQTKQHQRAAVGDSAPTTILRGRWLVIARRAWIVCAILTVIVLLGAVPIYYSHYAQPSLSYPYRLGRFDVLLQGLVGLSGLANSFISFALAVLLFRRKPNDGMALFTSFIFLIGALAWSDVLDYFLTAYAGAPSTRDLYLPLPVPLMILLFCIFPNGHFVPRWTRWLFLVSILISVLFLAIPESRSILPFTILPQFILLMYAQVYRYRHVSSEVERQQTKWVIFGLLMTIVLSVIASIIYGKPSGPLINLIPLSLAIAILHSRLWDVDLILNRTLVYGALTAGIVALYVLLVGALSMLSQASGNLLISLLATGLIAFLFQPLRERLQRGVNHLMYGDRDEPYAALARLGRRLEASLATQAVMPTVVNTVREVLKLPYVAIYIQSPPGHKIVAESASPSLRIEGGIIRVPGMEREGLCMPLIHQGETLGFLVLGPRAPNEAFSSTDLRLLDDLAPQVGVAVHAARLTADLQRSRERLVLAREEERRRLRRDLHDDLAPTLATLGLTASTAADLIPTNPGTATALVKELRTEIRATVGNIRRLVYDLRPPTLDELGLLAAVRERAAQYSNAPDGFHVTVDAPAELPALPAAVEVAAYRIAQEALENVSKHSQARQCTIRFANHNRLEIEITDDGIGLPPNLTPGVGLRSMRERAEELGGSCVIERGANCGTRVLASLPIGEIDGTFARPDRG